MAPGDAAVPERMFTVTFVGRRPRRQRSTATMLDAAGTTSWRSAPKPDATPLKLSKVHPGSPVSV
jgi:hypothetical protein